MTFRERGYWDSAYDWSPYDHNSRDARTTTITHEEMLKAWTRPIEPLIIEYRWEDK